MIFMLREALCPGLREAAIMPEAPGLWKNGSVRPVVRKMPVNSVQNAEIPSLLLHGNARPAALKMQVSSAPNAEHLNLSNGLNTAFPLSDDGSGNFYLIREKISRKWYNYIVRTITPQIWIENKNAYDRPDDVHNSCACHIIGNTKYDMV